MVRTAPRSIVHKIKLAAFRWLALHKLDGDVSDLVLMPFILSLSQLIMATSSTAPATNVVSGLLHVHITLNAGGPGKVSRSLLIIVIFAVGTMASEIVLAAQVKSSTLWALLGQT